MNNKYQIIFTISTDESEEFVKDFIGDTTSDMACFDEVKIESVDFNQIDGKTRAEELLENEPLKEMDIDELLIVKKFFTEKINGPENDGRVTADGSDDLDYWMDTVSECEAELMRKGYKGKKT